MFMLALGYMLIIFLTNRQANNSANTFTSDLDSMFTIDSANIFTRSRANIFTSDSTNMFTSDLANMLFSKHVAKQTCG